LVHISQLILKVATARHAYTCVMTTNPVVFLLFGDSSASEFYVQTFFWSKPVPVKLP